jgi:hypothetical protein
MNLRNKWNWMSSKCVKISANNYVIVASRAVAEIPDQSEHPRNHYAGTADYGAGKEQ